LSDQKEKPDGALPKGYDANTSSTEVVKQKKINFLELVRYTSTDQDQREKDLKEYETSYIARLEKNKPEESSDDFRVELGVSTESYVDLGRLNLRKHTITKRKQYLAERKEYEKKYLARYKQPKASIKKSKSWTESDVDLGRLTLRPYVNAKRKAKHEEIREYEKNYLSRYKQPKSKSKKLSSLKYDIDLGTLTLRQYVNAKRKAKQDEIKEYEKQYISRYKEPKPKKRAIQLEWEPEPKQDIKKERKDYENEFLTRYRKQEKAKPKKSEKQM